MKCQIKFSGKNKKFVSECHQLKLTQHAGCENYFEMFFFFFVQCFMYLVKCLCLVSRNLI